jgi:predicted nuclease of predicted toxin-antitoxin system
VKLWLDQMLPRRLCERISEVTGCDVSHVGAGYVDDESIFMAAREARALLVTKDGDFVSLLERLGTPPQMIWLRCGNRSNRELGRILEATLPEALALIERGEPIVEVTGA